MKMTLGRDRVDFQERLENLCLATTDVVVSKKN